MDDEMLSAVQDWARRNLPEHSGPDCQWCPLCQLAGVLRGEHPEVTERVAEAGTAVVKAVKSLIDVLGSPAEPETDRPRPRPRPTHLRPVDED